MSSPNRKPLLIAAMCAAIAVLVFALGSGFGGRDADGTAGWKDRLDRLKLSAVLEISELQAVGGNCRLEASRIIISGSCALAVSEFGGPFSLLATKHAELVPDTTVNLALTVEGTSITQKVDAGCRISAVFGRSGGTLTVICLDLTFPCTVELGHGKDCSKE